MEKMVYEIYEENNDKMLMRQGKYLPVGTIVDIGDNIISEVISIDHSNTKPYAKIVIRRTDKEVSEKEIVKL